VRVTGNKATHRRRKLANVLVIRDGFKRRRVAAGLGRKPTPGSSFDGRWISRGVNARGHPTPCIDQWASRR
jgi:hypothetical protein